MPATGCSARQSAPTLAGTHPGNGIDARPLCLIGGERRASAAAGWHAALRRRGPARERMQIKLQRCLNPGMKGEGGGGNGVALQRSTGELGEEGDRDAVRGTVQQQHSTDKQGGAWGGGEFQRKKPVSTHRLKFMLEAHAGAHRHGLNEGDEQRETTEREKASWSTQHILPACSPALALGSSFKQIK